MTHLKKNKQAGLQWLWFLILSVVLAETAGIIGSFFTFSAIQSWYAGLIKPSWNPPGWIFGPVWTSLYAMMGIAAFLVWKKRKTAPKVNLALTFYLIQLVLNTLWSIIFFGFGNIGLALGEIIVLWIFIVIVTVQFWKIDRYAGILFIPYLMWVTFAAFLNYTIWTLN